MTHTNFLALYRGRTVAESQLVAVTAEPEIVARFLREITGEAENPGRPEEQESSPSKLFRVVKGEQD
jgi:hypothetical protein